jgi:hypothetical protein
MQRDATLANLSQPLLRHDAGLIDGQLSELAEGGLAAHASVRPIQEHEHLATRGSDLA